MTDAKSAHDYDDVGAQAVLSVLLEIGQVPGASETGSSSSAGRCHGFFFRMPSRRTWARSTST